MVRRIYLFGEGIYLFGEGKDLVPALLAEFVEELRARDVRVVLQAGVDLFLPELLHEGLLQLAWRGQQFGERQDLTGNKGNLCIM